MRVSEFLQIPLGRGALRLGLSEIEQHLVLACTTSQWMSAMPRLWGNTRGRLPRHFLEEMRMCKSHEAQEEIRERPELRKEGETGTKKTLNKGKGVKKEEDIRRYVRSTKSLQSWGKA